MPEVFISAGLGTALYFGLLTLHYLAALLPRPTPAKWAKELREGQKTLLSSAKRITVSGGKPQTPVAKSSAPTKPATPKPTPPSLGPPLRAAKPIASPMTPQQQRGDSGGGPYTRGSPASHGSGLGYSTRVVSTPEQLQRYMDSFEASTRGNASPEPGYGNYGGSPFGYGATATDALPLGYGTGTAGVATPPGTAVLTYRPSLQARGKAGSPHRGDGRLSPSSVETLEAVLARLATGRRTLEVWTEQLRSWLASELLQPLDRLVATVQKDVIKATADLGWTGLQLSELDADTEAAGSGAAAKAGTGSRGGAPDADEALLLAQLTQRLRQQPAQPPPEIVACLKAVNQYQQLAALLRGEQPRALLPPTPRGYVAARLRQLAAGPVVAAFDWDGGGSWGGKPWSPELPTDSALLLYLFAAFLTNKDNKALIFTDRHVLYIGLKRQSAPKWEFALEEVGQSPQQAGPLFLGALPPRPPPAFSAILSFRPNANALSRQTFKFKITMLTRNHRTLMHVKYVACIVLAEKQPILASPNAKLSGEGFIGDRSLDYLKLSAVLKPGDPVYSIFSGRWFGLW
ncbi:hypothetical protein COCSUDRAFT_64788 [Coccomyxa subellipsoidea C-169]|uniref:Uncharacterized protein n=1 Tax=Coccomyxa subellipsoidea (strain C-169) TaxID=574566 RepID=I0Z4Y5_COCSC|nr:hypothetical protein COCSUDRAFT_64788 [Coccomyxa subellipsoidea C-169]EIE25704.1 hypothetical protein COCSUDRAFT_64788 [Coccomyxa subellipsoidea C-169]|eukprot:XP_005650248.1 hypothetical protein COCSUDRAFT_64788 [Coccomyxa subellipsoidea C-169]